MVKNMKRSTLGVRGLKVKVTEKQSYIWRLCGGIIIDPFGSSRFSILEQFFEKGESYVHQNLGEYSSGQYVEEMLGQSL